MVNYMVRKFSFCSNLYADVIANIIPLHIFINLKIVFNSWNVILKLKSFTQKGTYIIHKKRLTSRVAINFVDETRYCTSINHLDTPLYKYNTRKYPLGDSILLVKSTECTVLYIPGQFHGVWITTFFRGSVFYTTLIFEYLIWRTHIEILMLGKCNPLSQLRDHDVKIQIIHVEHYREWDNKYFKTMHIDNQ